MLWIFSQGKPMRSSTPGPKFSTKTSHFLISSVRTSLPFGFLVSSVIERLLWLSMVKYRLSTLGLSCSWPRVMSPTPGRSTLITSAPNQANNCVQVGPDWTWVKSRMRTPVSALVICLCSVSCLPCACRKEWKWPLFLFQNALRIEIADPPALGAGRRIDHGVDQGRLARIHRRVHGTAYFIRRGRVDGALEFVRRARVDAGAAERLHHLVAARSLDEDGRRNVGTAGRIDVGSAVDAVIVEDDDADRQIVAADGLDLHAGEAEG